VLVDEEAGVADGAALLEATLGVAFNAAVLWESQEKKESLFSFVQNDHRTL